MSKTTRKNNIKVIKPVKCLSGEITLPGDKSISHRLAILSALSENRCTISRFLMGKDCLATISCLRQLGVRIDVQQNENRVTIYGVGLRGLSEPSTFLDVANSGTTARLLLGVLAAQDFFSILTGDKSMCKRPMQHVIKPLMTMGASIDGRHRGLTLPLAIRGGELECQEYDLPVASAQLKSALLLAGLYAGNSIYERIATRNHTEILLNKFGANLLVQDGRLMISKADRLVAPENISVPGDISSAAFLIVAAALLDGSRLLIKQVGVNPTRIGFINALRMMGASIEIRNQHDKDGEPTADIFVKGGARLRSIKIKDEAIIASLIDELPVLCIAAACADGVTEIRGAGQLRYKESDRIGSIVYGLRKLDVKVEELEDGLCIYGQERLNPTKDVLIDSFGDHRIALAFAVAGLISASPIYINNWQADISFPGFIQLIKSIGIPQK